MINIATNDNNWYKLDNAAKIFPSVASRTDTKVFRIACELNQDVNGELLQKALIQNLDDFPIYRSILRRGIFWYYLESSDIEPKVSEDNLPPCFGIYTKRQKNLLYRVTYFKKRINLEVFHALTDGTGALEFLNGLVQQYLLLNHPDELDKNIVFSDSTSSISDKMFDDFQKHYYPTQKQKPQKNHKAYKITGRKFPDYNIRVIEGTLPVNQVLELAHKHGVTLTVLLVAILFKSVGKNMRALQKKRDVVATLPVNLRNFFPSETSRNFFCMVNINYNFSTNSEDISEIIKAVDTGLKTAATKENLNQKLNNLVMLEKHPIFRVIPLAIKDISLKIANNITLNGHTFGVSSLGVIKTPKELNPYIHNFDIFNSTNKLQLFICTYNNDLKLSFSSPYIDSNIQKDFFRTLVNLGMDVKISATPIEEV